MWPEANNSAERLAKRLGKIGIGGSDAHTIAGVGLTHTEVPGVRTVDEFLAGLRAGRGIVHGVHGSYAKLTADVYRIVMSFFGEKPWALPILPITVLVPAITASHWLNEMRFCRKWSAMLESEGRRPRMLWKLDSSLEANLAS